MCAGRINDLQNEGAERMVSKKLFGLHPLSDTFLRRQPVATVASLLRKSPAGAAHPVGAKSACQSWHFRVLRNQKSPKQMTSKERRLVGDKCVHHLARVHREMADGIVEHLTTWCALRRAHSQFH
jgi:hypothetical protein